MPNGSAARKNLHGAGVCHVVVEVSGSAGSLGFARFAQPHGSKVLSE
jgi:hypothetical protein